jgi:hypothetical protein
VTPALDLHEASELIERARRLVEPHRSRIPTLGFYLRVLRDDAHGLACIARNTRQHEQLEQRRLFA